VVSITLFYLKLVFRGVRFPYGLLFIIIPHLGSGNDRYLKQLSKLLEVLAEISENNERNNGNCKFEGAEDQLISIS